VIVSKRETSQITKHLDTRVRTNRLFGDNDLDQWLLQIVDPKAGDAILDAGCGTGNHLIKLALQTQNDQNCIGFDLSEESISEAKRKASARGLRIKFVVGDLNEMDRSPVQNDSFDVVISIYAIYYADDPKNTLAELSRKITPYGKLIIMGPHGDNNKGWFDFLSQFMELPKNIERISSRFMEEEVLPFAKQYFSDVRAMEFVNRISIPSYIDFRNYWVSNVYYKEFLDPGFEKSARAHFAKRESFDFFKKGLCIVTESRK
jgi:ubiquinone/menaquinone biosynthesis C-methylase UbiE